MINVLFVCIGNSCRSQMAEGFARKYGSDVMHPWSAGWAPADIVQPQTIAVMKQKNIDITEQFPKSLHELELNTFEVIVNMSGQAMPAGLKGEVLTWKITDPMTQPEEVYVKVRDQIEELVMRLVMAQRRGANTSPAPRASLRDSVETKPAKKQPVTKQALTKHAAPQRYGFGRVRPTRD